jgi:hypothetical protein
MSCLVLPYHVRSSDKEEGKRKKKVGSNRIGDLLDPVNRVMAMYGTLPVRA